MTRLEYFIMFYNWLIYWLCRVCGFFHGVLLFYSPNTRQSSPAFLESSVNSNMIVCLCSRLAPFAGCVNRFRSGFFENGSRSKKIKGPVSGALLLSRYSVFSSVSSSVITDSVSVTGVTLWPPRDLPPPP